MTAPPTPGSTDESLVRKACAGDEAALAQLVRLYGPLLRYWILRAQVPPQDVDDVLQDCAAGIVAGFANGKYQHRSLRGWLRVLTRSKVVDYLRRRPDMLHLPSQDLDKHFRETDGSGPEQAAAEEYLLLQQALRLARSNLGDKTWLVFWEVSARGRPIKDVADELGLPRNTVSKHNARVLARLRQILDDGIP